MKKTENDRGKSQVWRNSTTTTTTTASSVAFPHTVCVCAFPSAHQSAGEREKVREKTSRFIQLEWACSCALHRLMISPLPPQNVHSVLSVAEVGQSKRPRGLSVPVNTSSTFRRSA